MSTALADKLADARELLEPKQVCELTGLTRKQWHKLRPLLTPHSLPWRKPSRPVYRRDEVRAKVFGRAA